VTPGRLRTHLPKPPPLHQAQRRLRPSRPKVRLRSQSRPSLYQPRSRRRPPKSYSTSRSCPSCRLPRQHPLPPRPRQPRPLPRRIPRRSVRQDPPSMSPPRRRQAHPRKSRPRPPRRSHLPLPHPCRLQSPMIQFPNNPSNKTGGGFEGCRHEAHPMLPGPGPGFARVCCKIKLR
jgi:hypothetical protein